MEESKPSYYSIIPAYIRYDSRLNAQEKLMYGEITALSNAHGYCFASNSYFAKLYNCGINTVSRWISALEKCGHIRLELNQDKDTKRYTRKIYLLDRNLQIEKALAKNDEGALTKNDEGALTKNGEYNNINNNSTSVNIENQEKKIFFNNVMLTENEQESLKKQFGEDKANELIKELSLYKKAYGKQYNDDFSIIHLWVVDRVNKKALKQKKQDKEIDYGEFYDIGGEL